MRAKLVFAGVFIAIGLLVSSAKCVNYVWTSDGDQALYGDMQWRDTDIGDVGSYRFEPDYPVTEHVIGHCSEFEDDEYLGIRGPFICNAYVLHVETPDGTVVVTNVATLKRIFGTIDSESEAASFARAVLDGYSRYDGATAAASGNFLVRMTDVRDNCSETAGFYAIAYEITRAGETRIVAEEARRKIEGGGAICID
jgi:hypothetical protein